MTLRSYNGWPASKDPATIGVKPFTFAGHRFPGGVKAGDVATLFRYFLAQYHTRVENLGYYSAGDEWGYSFRQNRNADNLSCHSSGTAIDVNATRHPNGRANTLTYAQVTELRKILRECGGVIRWGGDFSGTKDEMHYEIAKTAADVKRIVVYRRSLPWFTRDLIPVGDPAKWQHGDDIVHVQARLKVRRTGRYDVATVDAVKRFQRKLGLTANGKVTRALAFYLG